MAGLRLGARTRMSGRLPCGGASPPTAPRQLHGPSRAACRALTREDGQPPEWPAICPGSGARAAAAWTARARVPAAPEFSSVAYARSGVQPEFGGLLLHLLSQRASSEGNAQRTKISLKWIFRVVCILGECE